MKLNDDDLVIDEEEIIDNDVEVEETETDPVDSDEIESEEDPATIQESDDEDYDEDRVVTIGDPEPDSEVEEEKKEMPKWVKNVRKSNRRLESENKKLQRQLEELTKPKEVVLKLGPKPTLAGCDYDEAKLDQELDKFYAHKIKVDEQAKKQQEIIKARTEQVVNRQQKYVELRKEHKFKDFGEAESLVENTFSLNQQEIIVQGADDAALLVYALGKNPKKLEELSKITNPTEFAFKVAKLESQLKVSNRKAPSPEKRVSKGKSNGVSGNSDKTLERLREEASRTGDFTAVTKYKRSLNKG